MFNYIENFYIFRELLKNVLLVIKFIYIKSI